MPVLFLKNENLKGLYEQSVVKSYLKFFNRKC